MWALPPRTWYKLGVALVGFAACYTDLAAWSVRADLRAAETLRAAVCAAINLFVLLSNAHNTDGIELALGAGTARFLNAHATVFADGTPHYWRAKLLKVVAPLAAGAPSDPIRFVITDAIPISQKRCPKGGKDEGLPIARLYAAASAPISSSPASRTCSRGCAARLASPQESEVRGANAGPRPGDGSRGRSSCCPLLRMLLVRPIRSN